MKDDDERLERLRRAVALRPSVPKDEAARQPQLCGMAIQRSKHADAPEPRRIYTTTLGAVMHRHGHIANDVYCAARRRQSELLREWRNRNLPEDLEVLSAILTTLDAKLAAETNLERVRCYRTAREGVLGLLEGQSVPSSATHALLDALTWYPALDEVETALAAKNTSPEL